MAEAESTNLDKQRVPREIKPPTVEEQIVDICRHGLRGGVLNTVDIQMILDYVEGQTGKRPKTILNVAEDGTTHRYEYNPVTYAYDVDLGDVRPVVEHEAASTDESENEESHGIFGRKKKK